MRVLVTAASKHGATAEIAKTIADELRSIGLTADHKEPHEVMNLDGYDALVVGSGAYYGHWLGEGKEFIERIQGQLETRPAWIFTSGPVGDPPRPDDEPPEVAAIVEKTHARGHTVFAGKIQRKGLGPMERVIMATFHLKDTDNRNWDEIRAWAKDIARELGATAS